ncbi:MAG: hypothetical protein MUD09_06150, partial [Desulfobacterales bacterium]|nr:hypothetical protein [Desulfobacterales bacterium]
MLRPILSRHTAANRTRSDLSHVCEQLRPESLPGAARHVHPLINPVPCSVIGSPFGSLFRKCVAIPWVQLEPILDSNVLRY